MRTRCVTLSLGLLLAIAIPAASAPAAEPAGREMPKPLAGHPGNIFLAGEEVTLTLPPAATDAWELLDYDGRVVAQGRGAGPVSLGRLQVGYYEVRRAGAEAGARPISLGVLAPLGSPTPETSPIALDVAMAWFYTEDKMPAVASLCGLAGVNWVRDRLAWGEVETQRGTFADRTRYDASARAQSAAGLRVLQVNHSSPAWASAEHSRFPTDLRDAYRFYRAMAARWKGQVLAFEPWNEADIQPFGGHIGSEMASMQKASYLGLKAGNPQVIACQNVFAAHQPAILADFHANQAWPYFDTFNLHHYAPVDSYGPIYADFRAVSAGRPLWVTECNVPVPWSGDEKLKEPSPADLRVQAERVAKVFAGSLFEGSSATFYFLLPHYVERQIQFGVIRPDLTPRPAYVALAAVGRLLADVQPVGRLRAAGREVRGFLFRAKPDGQERAVLVAWAAEGKAALPLPMQPLAVYDHLGRPQSLPAQSLGLSPAPVFAVFSADAPQKFELEPPPAPASRLEGKPSPVVLQAVRPRDRTVHSQSAYRVSSSEEDRIAVFVYNFGPDAVEGRLAVTSPQGWKVSLPEQVKVAAGDRVELALVVDLRGAVKPSLETVTIRGDFGQAGAALLSLRLLPD